MLTLAIAVRYCKSASIRAGAPQEIPLHAQHQRANPEILARKKPKLRAASHIKRSRARSDSRVSNSPYAPERKRSSNDANERESSLEK
jgi:hypothetical protein